MNGGNICLLTSVSIQDPAQYFKSSNATRKNAIASFLNANLVHRKGKWGQEGQWIRLQRQHCLSKIDCIFNRLPETFYSGLFQTYTVVLDERPATCPLSLPPHHWEICCVISIITGSTTPPWTWLVNSSNKNLKASILVTANNLNNVCSNHSRKLLQLSCLSQVREPKRGRAEGGWFFSFPWNWDFSELCILPCFRHNFSNNMLQKGLFWEVH